MNQIVLTLREGCPMALYLVFTCFSANLVAQLAEIRHKTGFSAINSAHCSRVVAIRAILPLPPPLQQKSEPVSRFAFAAF
jgi:hypothetical protein